MARNSISEQIVEISLRPDATFHDVAELASGAQGRENVLRGGDVEGGMWWASMAQGLMASVGSCADVVDEIMREAEALITKRLPSLVAADA